ncbi:hypothetical protein [Nocardiopsis sp. NPDC058789]|uniref:hypothetical protein n=1 Tax=Nocardiopsis sp. NPDC058789 TaxID=3346634 RepID=UPI00366B8BEB
MKRTVKARDLGPGEALVSPPWMVVTDIEERGGVLRVHGWTTLHPGEDVTVQPPPGSAESARHAAREIDTVDRRNQT